MATLPLAPAYFQPFDLTPITSVPTTLTQPSAKTGTSVLDIINSLGSIALGGILLAKTPSQNLPKVNTATVSTTGTNVQAQTFFTTQNILLIVAGIVLLFVLFRKG